MAASARSGHKRKKKSASVRSGRKARSVPATPLKASRDATRKQDLQRKRAQSPLQQRPADASIAHIAGLEMMGLMSRRAQALLELPLRMVRCRSPLAIWGVQTQFMYGMLNDWHTLTQRMVAGAVKPTLWNTRVT
jgi:hypothetical protein